TSLPPPIPAGWPGSAGSSRSATTTEYRSKTGGGEPTEQGAQHALTCTPLQPRPSRKKEISPGRHCRHALLHPARHLLLDPPDILRLVALCKVADRFADDILARDALRVHDT